MRSRNGSRSPMRTRAYVRANTPSWMTCAPMSVRATKPSIVWICQLRPKTSTGPVARTIMPTSPRPRRIAPGTRYSQLGLYRSMKRTCLQASPKRFSFDSPVRG